VLYSASYAVRKAASLHGKQPLRQTLVRGFLPLFAVMVVVGGLPAAGAGLRRAGRDRRDRLRHPVHRRARLALFFVLALLLPAALSALLVAEPYRIQRLVHSSTRGPIPSARATSCRTR